SNATTSSVPLASMSSRVITLTCESASSASTGVRVAVTCTTGWRGGPALDWPGLDTARLGRTGVDWAGLDWASVAGVHAINASASAPDGSDTNEAKNARGNAAARKTKRNMVEPPDA